MYSSNPSFESLKHDKFYQSSFNPNLSTTNLHQLNYKNFNSSSSLSLFEPAPKRFGSPITPPISTSNTPVKEHFKLDQPSTNGRIFILCANWYFSSIVSNYSTKLILSSYKYPITLTQFQFVLNFSFCLILLTVLMKSPHLSKSFPVGTIPDLNSVSIKQFIYPTKFILKTTLPMGLFQFAGHVTSHNATSIIPVSINHTIKALSPITTVVIYRVLFNKKYNKVTYLTLVPLMMGIMLSCYKKKTGVSESNYVLGLIYSFVSMIIFVSQNIFAKGRLTIEKKNLLPNNDKCEKKLDKLSILYYCSLIGFIFTLPVYLISEYNNTTFSLFDLTGYSLFLIVVNGISHFVQSLLAFQILGLISPINYSIANILKRIMIILVAFVIEGKGLSYNQVFGIGLTVIGLVGYDRYGH